MVRRNSERMSTAPNMPSAIIRLTAQTNPSRSTLRNCSARAHVPADQKLQPARQFLDLQQRHGIDALAAHRQLVPDIILGQPAGPLVEIAPMSMLPEASSSR